MAKRLSIDVGGTFTDLVLVDDKTGQRFVDKVASTPNSGLAVIAGIQRISQAANIQPSELDVISHGFTIATNAWLTRTGADVTLLVTSGFGDVLSLGSQRRPHTYHLAGKKPLPLITNSHVIEVTERIDAFGTTVIPLTDKTINDLKEQLADRKPEAIAISLLFSWLNPDHEKQLAQELTSLFPSAPIYCSHIVNPQIEEYPRANTTVAAAYVGPPVRTYTESLESELKACGIQSPLRYIRSDGGAATSDAARANPANMLLSGPAGGVVAAAKHGAAADIGNLITFDMGGTSADFSVIRDGQTSLVHDSVIDGLPLRVPMLEIKAISAGGGSLGWVDKGGALRIGPQSAGAKPGPAAYGAGGTKPTLTDAALVLGYLLPDSFAGGDIPLDKSLAEAAVNRHVAEPLNLDVISAARGMFAVGTANMAQAIRELSTERGDDIAEFTLLSFGGAGGLFAPFLLRELGLNSALVPRHPGVFAALGLHFTDLRHHRQTTFSQSAEDVDISLLQYQLDRKQNELNGILEADGVLSGSRLFQFSAQMRYVGQHHQLEIPLPSGNSMTSETTRTIVRNFHDQHERRYGYCHRESPTEFTSLHAVGIGVQSKPGVAGEALTSKSPPIPLTKKATALAETETAIYKRDSLRPGHQVVGPAIIIQDDSTLVVLSEQKIRVDATDLLHLTENSVT